MIGVGDNPRDEGATRRRREVAVGPDAPRRIDPGERAAWIVLAAIPGVGPVGFRRIVERYGTARDALGQPATALGQLIARPEPGTTLALERARRRGVERIAAELTVAADRCGARAVTALDGDYPPRLARLAPHPPVLWVNGSLEALAGPAVAVVGTRRPSGYGRAAAAEVADELARAGACVVSGLAIGIDGIAHRAALDAGGITVAVLPSSLDRIYPPRHRELAAAIAQHGAVLSESPPGRPAGKPDFARRNRVISGLVDAVVVVEAPDRSGALLTAAAAVQQGRDLYAVPGPIDAATSRGCNRLIADHQAELVTSAVALVQRVGMRPAGRSSLALRLSEAEALVVGRLLQRSGSIEELMDRTGLDTSSLAGALTLLEARGLVTSYGGATFHATLLARRAGEGIGGGPT